MNMNRRPISVTIVAFLYLAVGVAGLVFHLREILARHAFQNDDAIVEFTELVAIMCGAFLLQGRNWARWLAMAWMVFHVILSAFDRFRGFAIHSLLCVVIAWALFRPEAAEYFRGQAPTTGTGGD